MKGAILRPGIYLEQNRPARSQYRIGRRDPGIRSVITVHTAQSGTDLQGQDDKAENVAAFIQRRKDAGSYALIGDRDSVIQLVSFENEAFHDGTGGNRWSIGISLAMNAEDWPHLPSVHRRSLLITAAQMADFAGDWLETQGLPRPMPLLLSKGESEDPRSSGFISHALRDPARRSDPGDFPWAEFFELYTSPNLPKLQSQTIETKEPTVATKPNEYVRQIQDLVGATVDGIAGPQTLAKVETALKVNADRASAFEQQRDSALSALANLEANEVDGQKWRDFMTLISTTKGGNQ